MFKHMNPADTAAKYSAISTSAVAPQSTLRATLHWLLDVLRRRRGAIAGISAVALALSGIVVAILPARYTASTQVLIEPRELRVLEKSVTEPSAINDTATAKIESQARVLTSESVLRRVIAQDALMADLEFNGQRPSFAAGLFKNLFSALASNPDPVQEREKQQDISAATLEALQRRVTVKLVPRTFVVELSVMTSDRAKSARIANDIVQAYLDDQASARATSARRASSSLTARLSELRQALQTAEQRVEQFRKENSIVAANGQLVSENQAVEINSQLTFARAKTAEKKARYDQVRQLQRSGSELGSVTDAVQSPTVSALRTQYAEVARRESELTASLGPRHPRVVETKAELARSRALVGSELGRLAQSSRNEYEQAKASEASLARSLDVLKGELLRTREAFVRLRELERDAEAKRNIYEASAVRARELSEQEFVDTTNVRIISAAEPPRKPSWPPSRLLLLAFGLFFGVAAGTGYALLREQIDGPPDAARA